MRIVRFLRWIGAILLGLVALAAAAFGGLIAYDVLFSGQSAEQFANTTYPAADGPPLNAYLAHPAGDGPHPAVLLIHEWWGLNEDIVSKADVLTAEGYVALAVDTWRGVSTRSAPRAVSLIATTPQERVNADLDAALNYLLTLEDVDSRRVAVLGFCYGGGQSLRFGLRHPELAATILFYGPLIMDMEELDSLRQGGPVLGIFAEKDIGIPTERVKTFEQMLNDLGIEHQITIYPGVRHGFANQMNAIATAGPAMDAWKETLAFLEATVKGEL